MEAVPWFETPRTRLRNLANSMLAAPHHEAGRDRGCIKLIGIRSRRRVAIRCEPTLSALRAGRVEPVALPSRIISRCTVLSSAATSRCVAASAQPGCSGALFDVLMEDRRREIIENKRSSPQNRSAGAADRLILTAPTRPRPLVACPGRSIRVAVDPIRIGHLVVGAAPSLLGAYSTAAAPVALRWWRPGSRQ